MGPAVFDIEGAETSLQLPEQHKQSIRNSQDIHSSSTGLEESVEVAMKQPDECGSSTDEQSQPEGKYSRHEAHEPVRPFLVHSTLKWEVEPEKNHSDIPEIKTNDTKQFPMSGDDKIETSELVDIHPDDAQDECLKQSTTIYYNVGGNQRILRILDSPRKDPVLVTRLEEDPVGDNRSRKDEVILTDPVSNISIPTKILPSTLLLNEPNDDSIEIPSKSDSTDDNYGKSQSIQIEDVRKSSFKESHLKLKEIKCKSCKAVFSTREALKMHTCYSILDRIIQSDGGTRRNSSQKETKIEVTPSSNAAPKSVTVKTKSKKKSNLIIATKDDKLSNGEIAYDYSQSRDQIEEMMKADRVNENLTRLVNPILEKDNDVFDLNPPVLHEIRDKPQSENSPTKRTIKSMNDGAEELVNSSKVAKAVSSSAVGIMTETEKISKPFGTQDPLQNIDAARALQHIAKTKAKLKVDLPKQSLSQLKRKAERQDLAFDIRHSSGNERTDEKRRDSSREMEDSREKDPAPQKEVAVFASNRFQPSDQELTESLVDNEKEHSLYHESTGVLKCKRGEATVCLPKQSLSQLRCKAELQGLTFKRSHYREIFLSKDLQQIKLNHKEKHSDNKYRSAHNGNSKGIPQNKHDEKRSDSSKEVEDSRQKDHSSLKEVGVSASNSSKSSDQEVKESLPDYEKEQHLYQKSTDVFKSKRKELTVCLPKQSLSQLRSKAELHGLTFKRRYYRDIFPSKGSQQIKLKHKEKHSDDKHRRKHQTNYEHNGHSDENPTHQNKHKYREDCVNKKSKDISTKSDSFGNSTKVNEKDQKDSVKKVPTDVPKTVEIEDTPPRKRHNSDMTPTSHKESSERKVKCDERHSDKNELNSSLCKSVSSPTNFKIPKSQVPSPDPFKFKIPKNEGGKLAMKVKGFATNVFLENESIKPMAVGESGRSILDSLLSDIKGDSSKAIEMFDKIDSKQNKMANNKRHEANEAKERSDIMHKGWDQVKNVKDDRDRKKLSEQTFGNPVSNNPNINLTYHGYKRYKSRKGKYPLPNPFVDFLDTDKKKPMYRLTNGATKPLPGYRFRQQSNIDGDQFCEENHKKIKLEEFVTLMKTVMYNKKAKKKRKGDDAKAMEDFETFLGHYKAGQEETTHFLEFYQKQGQVELEGWQAIQIMDLQNQFSAYSRFYGLTDELRCETCNKEHTFAL